MSFQNRLKLILSHPIGYVLIWIVAYGLLFLIGSHLSSSVDALENVPLFTVILHVSALFAVLVAVLIIIGGYNTSHFANYSVKSLGIALIPVLVIFVATMLGVRALPSSTMLIMLNGICLILISFIIGELLSREVMHPGHLMPVAAVLALVDLWSVGQGPSKEIAKQVTEFAQNEGYAGKVTPDWTLFLLLRFPQPVTSEIYAFIGIGDLVILAFLIGCIHRFNLPRLQSYIALVASPVVAVLIANLSQRSIPALPVIASIFIAVNFKSLKMKRQDLAISISVIVFIALVMTILRYLR